MKRKFTNVVLVSEEGEYSANPADYFMMKDSDRFPNTDLVGTIHRKGWSKVVVIKKNPKKSDLKKVI